jgi:hypothetical protein
MSRAMLTVAGVIFLFSTAAISQPVTFDSPCSCHDNHGKTRSPVKNDPAKQPTDARAFENNSFTIRGEPVS